MKRLTCALLSWVMLFLGMGTAWAETVPTPTFTPSSGTVTPGSEIEFTLPEEVVTGLENEDYVYAFILYVENGTDVVLESDDVNALLAACGMGGGGFMTAEGDGTETSELPYKVSIAIFDGEGITSLPLSISADASGSLNVRARLAVTPDNETLIYSEETSMDFTVEGEVAKPTAPTFNPASGTAVTRGTKVTMSNGLSGGEYAMYYTTDGSEEFISKTTMDALEALDNITSYTEGEDEIEITQETTIKAATCKMSFSGDDILLLWSDLSVASYTIKEEGGEDPTPDDKPTAPTFDPASSAVDWGTTISLTHENAEDETGTYYYYIYVTVNGSEEFVKKTNISMIDIASYATLNYGSLTITGPVTIKAAVAKATEDDIIMDWSDITTAEYTLKADANRPTAPTFNPASGEVPAGQAVRLTNGYENDETPKLIYYNFKPTTNNFVSVKTQSQLTSALNSISKNLIKYDATTGIVIDQNRPNVNAATASIDADGNVTWSEIVTTSFKVGAARPMAPTFSPDGGEVGDDNNTLTLTMSVADQAKGAEIWYVVNGNGHEFEISNSSNLPREIDPEAEGQLILYQGPITITKSQTIHAAVVWEEGNSDMGNPLTWSEVVKKVFTFTGTPVAPKPAKPVISPANDANVHIGDKVTITCDTEDATIRYTTDGNNPTAESAVYTEPFALTGDMLIPQMGGKVFALKINAAAFKDGTMSDVVEVGLNVFPNKPVFTPDGSEEVEANSTVTITCEPSQAKIYYTLNGAMPNDEGSNATLYTEPIKITETTTIKARAILGQYTGSGVTATFTVAEGGTTEPTDTVATPTFNPAAGEVEKGTKVEIACTTEDAKIYYTVNGTEPTAESTEYKEAVVINEAMTIKAIAIKGETKSKVAEAAYTIKTTANEGLELSGVSVYPNPSDGEFTLDLPVAATVEVFASTGVMVQRLETGAGIVTLNIDRSGIYFLRITGEGRTTVKRVVVR